MPVTFRDSGDNVLVQMSATSGVLTFAGPASANVELRNGVDPTGDAEGVTKIYADLNAVSPTWLSPVVAAQSTNIDLTNPPATVDGETVATDGRILLWGQTDSSENGIYLYQGTGVDITSSRSTDLTTGDSAAGVMMFVESGTYRDASFTCTSASGSDVVGTDDLTFTQFSSLYHPHNVIARFETDGAGDTVASGAGNQSTTITWSSEEFSSTNPQAPSYVGDTVTINESGWYHVSYELFFEATLFAASVRYAAYLDDGGGVPILSSSLTPYTSGSDFSTSQLADDTGTGTDFAFGSTGVHEFADGDTFSLVTEIYVNNNGSQAVCNVASRPCKLIVRKIPGLT